MTDPTPYMNDPDIINEPSALREVHAVRLQISEEIKNCSPEERAERANRKGIEIMERYGLSHLRVTSP
jgi:hypothetical protein